MNQVKEKKVEMTEEGLNRGDERGVPTDLFSGEYNEEDSARYFQEALRQWRGEKSDEAGEPMSEEAMWIPVRPGELHRNGCRHIHLHKLQVDQMGSFRNQV